MPVSDLIRIIPGAAGKNFVTALVLSNVSGNLDFLWVPVQPEVPTPPLPTLTTLEPRDYKGRQVHAIHLRADGLQPLTAYRLTIQGATVPTSNIITTFGDGVERLRIGVWSCYHDDGGSGARLANAIASLKPGIDMKLLLGDNIYLDQPLRMGDPRSEVSRRYLERFFEGSYAEALAHAPTYTTWDDHEFWNNYPESQIWLAHSKGAKRQETVDEALACLDLYQHSLNVGPKLDGEHRSYAITETPLVDIFVADLRSQRELDKTAQPLMMHKNALRDLQDWASQLKRPGILALGQPMWIPSGDMFDYNPPHFRTQYHAIWSAIASAPYDILILSGDVHHSRLLRFNLKFGDRQHTVYECVTTPANHIPEGSANVAFPAEIDDSHIPGDPRLHSLRNGGYIMGTNSRSTFAVLEIFRDMSGRVGISITFRDMLQTARGEASRVADNQWARVTRKIYRNRTTETLDVRGIGGPLGPNKCQAYPIYLGERL